MTRAAAEGSGTDCVAIVTLLTPPPQVMIPLPSTLPSCVKDIESIARLVTHGTVSENGAKSALTIIPLGPLAATNVLLTESVCPPRIAAMVMTSRNVPLVPVCRVMPPKNGDGVKETRIGRPGIRSDRSLMSKGSKVPPTNNCEPTDAPAACESSNATIVAAGAGRHGNMKNTKVHFMGGILAGCRSVHQRKRFRIPTEAGGPVSAWSHCSGTLGLS